MDPVDRLLRLLEVVSEEEDAEKGHAAADLLRWLDRGGFVPLATSPGEDTVTTRERTLRLRGILRRIARRFAEVRKKSDPRCELLACSNEMNRVAAELDGRGLVDADDLRLLARAGLAALDTTKPA